MKSPTSKLASRLPITPSRQPLTLVLFSADSILCEGLLMLLTQSRKFSPERDAVRVAMDAAQALEFGGNDSVVMFVDPRLAAVAAPALLRLNSAAALVMLRRGSGDEKQAEELRGGFPIDDELDVPPTVLQVDTLLRRMRELVYLRGRTFNQGDGPSENDKLRRLNRIGVALSNERNLSALLSVILTEARSIMDADAGSIYIIEAGSGAPRARRRAGDAARQTQAAAVKRSDFTTKMFSLRFAAAQNDSVNIPFDEIVFPANMESIAGYAALTGEIVSIEDVYRLPPGVPYRFNATIDKKFGYHTQSMLTIPLKNTYDEVVGVVQLINKKRDPSRRIDLSEESHKTLMPFSAEDIELASSLSSQAGVAIENVRLADAIQKLFESFVFASMRAIEQRDPSTAGHSARVDRVTLALAQAVNEAKEGPFKDQHFSDSELTELHYACLLHDFGKIGVREHVLTKAKKLYPWESDAIAFRGEVIRRELMLAALDDELSLLRKGASFEGDEVAELRMRLQLQVAELDGDLEFIRKHTEPGFLPDDALARLKAIHAKRYRGRHGEFPLILDREMHSLSTRRGSLNDEERREIENHVSDSWKFLRQIPWTADLSRVPEIAGQHHEKMNGKGYPNGVPASQTPLGSRLMAVADVFDSLTAGDRPYKPAIPLERAMEILEKMALAGDLDPDVVKLLKEAKVWEKLKLKVVRLSDATPAQLAAQ